MPPKDHPWSVRLMRLYLLSIPDELPHNQWVPNRIDI